MSGDGWTKTIEFMSPLAEAGNLKISVKEWEEFNVALTLYLLEGQRVGQAFCNHFNIGVTPLFYFTDPSICFDWIKNNYL